MRHDAAFPLLLNAILPDAVLGGAGAAYLPR